MFKALMPAPAANQLCVAHPEFGQLLDPRRIRGRLVARPAQLGVDALAIDVDAAHDLAAHQERSVRAQHLHS
jgi:hypothetical protein